MTILSSIISGVILFFVLIRVMAWFEESSQIKAAQKAAEQTTRREIAAEKARCETAGLPFDEERFIARRRSEEEFDAIQEIRRLNTARR